MLEGFLVVVLAAFGVYFIDDGESWAGAAFVFASGALFGMGIVLWKPWAFLRRRRR